MLSSTPRAYTVAGVRGRASGWLPRSRFASRISGRHRTRTMVACRAVRRPPTFSGLGTVSILTIDLDKGLWEVDADAVMTDAQTVYGSTGHLYVATQRWIDPQTAPGDLPTTTTLIHRFDVSDPDRTTYEASGEVPGYLLNQYSLSEQGGDLRVASTADPVWWQGAPAGLVAEPRDRAAPRRARPSPPSAASRAWARGSASTRCASSATSATS